MRTTIYRATIGAFLATTIPFGGSAVAQSSTGAKPAEATSSWVKLCSTDPKKKKQICLTSMEIRSKTGLPLSSVLLIEPEGETRKIFRVMVPPGMQIQPGLAVQVDKSKQRNAKFAICFPNTCFGEIAVDDAFVNQLKAGSNLEVTAINHLGQQVPYKFSLVGFTAANEGKGIDPAAFEAKRKEDQKKFLEAARKRSEKLFKKLKEGQNKATEKAMDN